MFGHQPEHCTVAKQKALVRAPQAFVSEPAFYRAGREAGRGILIHEHSETLTQTICFAMIAASQ